MCGIVGYVGNQQAAPLILEGLARLEYRGYDSAGIAVLEPDGQLCVHKDVGKLESLRKRLNGAMPRGFFGIGHTRWATHGGATIVNAHPHTDTSGDVVVIHNGIVENYRELKEELVGRGHMYRSETDTEVIPHLIAEGIDSGLDLEASTRAAMSRIRGAAAVLAMRRQEPGVLVAARVANAGGVVIGYGDDAMHVASDLPALLGHVSHVVFLEDGDIARVTAAGATYSRLNGAALEKQPQEVPADSFDASKGLFEHFLLKEIHEQPDAILDTIRAAAELDPPSLHLSDLPLSDAQLQNVNRAVLVGMGTSYHACMIGRTYIERLAGIPAEFENASEFRYREPIIDQRTLVIAVGQSGESVDTLAAMQEAKQRGALLVTICNTPGSQAVRMADGTVFMRCGPEIAVASTKTLVGSYVALYLLACRLGEARGYLSKEGMAKALADLSLAPQILGEALKSEAEARTIAQEFYAFDHFLFLGRGLQFPVAMEGALKLKEVSYIHAEGYAAAEMKHGPISLIDNRMPVVAIAPRDEHYEKMLSNVAEVRARDGIIIALASAGDHEIEDKAHFVIRVPEAPPLLRPLATVVPLQFLAYYIALLRGCDIDQPRNLAKTVTVE